MVRKTSEGTTLKYCKDCRWWIHKTLDLNSENIDLCAEPSLQVSSGVSLVTGRPLPPKKVWAENERNPYGQCGPDAKLFQPRETNIQVAPEKVQV